MKIYFLVGHIFPPKASGGGNLFNRKMYEYLVAHDEDVEIINLVEFLSEFNRHFVSRLPVFSRLWRIFWFALRLPKPRRAVLFEDHYFLRDLFLYNLLLPSKARVLAAVYHFEDYRSGRSSVYECWKERLYLRGVEMCLAISKFTARELASLGRPVSRIWLVPCGHDPVPMDLRAKAGDSISLLFVGHYRPRKGLHHLVEAFSGMGTCRAVLHLVGRKEDPEYFANLMRVVREHNAEDRIIFHGQVSDDELAHLYASADIFVFPSLWEGFGIVLLEAMSYGLPIIATDVAAIPELVKDGENGLLVEPGDVDGLAAAISRLVGDKGLRERMGERGREIASCYSWERSGELFYQAIRHLRGGLIGLVKG